MGSLLESRTQFSILQVSAFPPGRATLEAQCEIGMTMMSLRSMRKHRDHSMGHHTPMERSAAGTLACLTRFLAVLASTGAATSSRLPAGLVSAGCPAETVPWPTADPAQFVCQPVGQAGNEAFLYLVNNMFEFDRSSQNLHSLVDGIFNNTVNKSLSARQQCVSRRSTCVFPAAELPQWGCASAVNTGCVRQVSMGCCGS